MDRQAIESLLAPINGATFAALDTQTECPLKGGKANPQQGRIVKRCLGNRVMLFTNKRSNAYENKVKRHLEQAGLDPEGFSVGSLPWGHRVPDSPFIEHKGKLYLQVVFLAAGEVAYFRKGEQQGENVWYEPITKADIIGLPDKTGSEHQALPQGKEVIVRTYAIDSIQAIRCFGSQLESDCKRDIGLWSH